MEGKANRVEVRRWQNGAWLDTPEIAESVWIRLAGGCGIFVRHIGAYVIIQVRDADGLQIQRTEISGKGVA